MKYQCTNLIVVFYCYFSYFYQFSYLLFLHPYEGFLMFYFSFDFVSVSFCCRYVVLHKTITGPGNSPTTQTSQTQTRTSKQEQKTTREQINKNRKQHENKQTRTTRLFHRNQVQIYTKNGIYYKKTPLCRSKRVQIETKNGIYYKKTHYFVEIGSKLIQNMAYITNRPLVIRSNKVQIDTKYGIYYKQTPSFRRNRVNTKYAIYF